ncbi:MAG: hypothetical protein DMF61_10510 [Blastocatellia bacterium AA13]|nr:MAG: hypothetical protein DMF61_10510 [Blastocatellia bacterium AA13]
MIRYDTQIDGRSSVVEYEDRNGKCAAVVDGRRYEFEVAKPEPGAYQIFTGNSVHSANVSGRSSDKLVVRIRGREYSVSLIDRKHRRAGMDSHGEGLQSVVSPMPGKVVKLLCAVGDEISAGQGVIVVEAMKMQNEIKSSGAGSVIEIRVAEGYTVEAGEVLLVIE